MAREISGQPGTGKSIRADTDVEGGSVVDGDGDGDDGDGDGEDREKERKGEKNGKERGNKESETALSGASSALTVPRFSTVRRITFFPFPSLLVSSQSYLSFSSLSCFFRTRRFC